MQNVERDITNLSLAREASEDSLSEAVSLYSSKDTLSASETWLRSRAIAQYVPEPSPKSPLVSCHLNSPNKDSFKERDISSKADESESSTDRSILGKDLNQNMPEEQSTTPRAGGIFRIKHASAELLSASSTLSELQRIQQASPQTPVAAKITSDESRSDELFSPSASRIVLDPVDDPDRETRRLRERARMWATREGLTSTQAAELEMLMDLAASTYIPRGSIECLRQIDRGFVLPSPFTCLISTPLLAYRYLFLSTRSNCAIQV